MKQILRDVFRQTNDGKGLVVSVMKEKLRRFMQGRYGVDSLSMFLIGLSVVMMLLSRVVRINFIYGLGFAPMIWSYFRVFSKNHYQCTLQNQKYLKLKAKVTQPFHNQISMMKQRKTHRIYSCPSCKQKVRIPKGKGKVQVTCPKCQTKFSKVS